MSKLSASDARVESRSVDRIFCSPFLLSAPLDGLFSKLVLFEIGFRTLFVLGFNTSPNASNSNEVKNLRLILIHQK